MGRRAEVFKLFTGEDIDGDQMYLGVAVLASLGGAHFDDFAGAAFNDYMSILAQSGTLHWVGGRGAGIGRLESMLMLRIRVSSRSSYVVIPCENLICERECK